jgi:hypothetical protein
MGQKLLQLYDFVGKQGGLPAQMRVAMKTLLPSNKAAAAADTPEMIAKFRAAIREVTGKEAPQV